MSDRRALGEFSSTAVQERHLGGSTLLSDYWALTKPEVNFLILITTFVSFYLASANEGRRAFESCCTPAADGLDCLSSTAVRTKRDVMQSGQMIQCPDFLQISRESEKRVPEIVPLRIDTSRARRSRSNKAKFLSIWSEFSVPQVLCWMGRKPLLCEKRRLTSPPESGQSRYSRIRPRFLPEPERRG